MVDNFGIKYVGKEHIQHLLGILKEHYMISEGWSGTKFIGLTIDWDYCGCKVNISMPMYIQKVLTRFQHEGPHHPQNSPHKHIAPNYGAEAQFVEPDHGSPLLTKEQKKYAQAVTRNTVVLCAGSGSNNFDCVECNCNTIGSTYTGNVGQGETVVRLLCKSGRSSNNLPCKQYDFSSA